MEATTLVLVRTNQQLENKQSKPEGYLDQESTALFYFIICCTNQD